MLTAIDRMPADVVAGGDRAVARYLERTTANTVARQQVSSMGLGGAWQVAKCVAAITVAIGGVALPISKVLKIKKLIKEVGGVKTLAGKIIEVAKSKGPLPSRIKKIFSSAGQGAVGLAAEVLGIDAIKNECF